MQVFVPVGRYIALNGAQDVPGVPYRLVGLQDKHAEQFGLCVEG
jgi:hypothetical protein